MQIFTDALYRDYKPDALERYDQAISRSPTGEGEDSEKLKVDSKLFSEVLQMIDENRKEFRRSDEKEYEKLDDGEEYQNESREYTLQEQYNYKYEVKPQGVQQEILAATIASSDFSPSVLSGNNQGEGTEAASTSVVVEDSNAQQGNDGFSFGQVEASIVAERSQSPADEMLGEISTSQQSIPMGNAATDPTLPDPSVTKV